MRRTALLLTILFLPEGLGSIVSRLRRHGSTRLTPAGEEVPPDIDASGRPPALVLPADAPGNRAAERVS